MLNFRCISNADTEDDRIVLLMQHSTTNFEAAEDEVFYWFDGLVQPIQRAISILTLRVLIACSDTERTQHALELAHAVPACYVGLCHGDDEVAKSSGISCWRIWTSRR